MNQEIVLDASALIAFLAEEAGADQVAKALQQVCVISAVNWAEVLTKARDRGATDQDLVNLEQNLALTIIDFDPGQAMICARLRSQSRTLGLSLGDRACLALALQRGAVALTADRAWLNLAEDMPIRCIR